MAVGQFREFCGSEKCAGPRSSGRLGRYCLECLARYGAEREELDKKTAEPGQNWKDTPELLDESLQASDGHTYGRKVQGLMVYSMLCLVEIIYVCIYLDLK